MVYGLLYSYSTRCCGVLFIIDLPSSNYIFSYIQVLDISYEFNIYCTHFMHECSGFIYTTIDYFIIMGCQNIIFHVSYQKWQWVCSSVSFYPVFNKYYPMYIIKLEFQFTFSGMFLFHEHFVKCFTYFDINTNYLLFIWTTLEKHSFEFTSF